MIVDLGTGDGRAVLARAAVWPRNLVIGIDADARSMVESSRRAAGTPGRVTEAPGRVADRPGPVAGEPGPDAGPRSRGARRGRASALANALFVVAAAESIPPELAGVADELTVTFPWGSLLRGILGMPDARPATAGIAALLAPGGRATFLVSVAARDRLPTLDRLDDSAIDRLARAHAAFGLRLVDARPATAVEIAASHSSWARRLRVGGPDRTAWRIELVRDRPEPGATAEGPTPGDTD